MRIKTLLIALSLALFSLPTARIARAQKHGEAQFVSFDENNWPTLRFADKNSLNPSCGFFVSYALTDKQEEAFALRVAHLHYRARFSIRRRPADIGGEILPESGWLYITRSRISFVVVEGDKSHAFDVPGTGLQNKPVSSLDQYFFSGIKLKLRERLPASDSREQKFVFLLSSNPACYNTLSTPDPYKKLLKQAVSDFTGAMNDFKRIAASLKQSGRIEQAPASASPPHHRGVGIIRPHSPSLRRVLRGV
jgi:hypothetical protein